MAISNLLPVSILNQPTITVDLMEDHRHLHFSEKGVLAIVQILEATDKLQRRQNGRWTKLFI